MEPIGRFGSYVRENRRAIARDLLVAVVWVTLLRWVFETQGYSEWLYYVFLFGGLIVYAAVIPAETGDRESRSVD